MADRDRFELDLAAGLRAYLEDAPTEVRPIELARQFATAYPHRRAWLGRWDFRPAPALVWLLLVAGLIAALVCGALIAGSQLRPGLPAVVPPIAIGQLYECPPGSTPDKSGPADQAGPTYAALAKVVFDRRAGRLVTVSASADGSGPETWTFDVCTNTWTRMHPSRELPDFVPQLVYDVDSDATIGIVSGADAALPRRVWAYDLEANTWTEKGVAPSQVTLGAYDPGSGLVVAATTSGDAIDLWTYDVESDAWTQIRPANGPPCGYWASAYDASVDRWVTYRGTGWGLEKAMCLIDTGSGTWSGTRAVTPPDFGTGFYALIPSVVYVEATGRTVISDGTRLAAYDATTDRWETLVEAEPGGLPLLMAYDPLHRRLVGVGQREDLPDVAFDPVTRAWTVLARDPTGGPWRPSPAPTRLEPGGGQLGGTQAATSAPTPTP